jgi:hypothetical protein
MIAATRRQLLAAAAAALAAPPARAQTPRTRVRLMTEQGVIVAELADDKAPITVANFLHYVDSGLARARRADGRIHRGGGEGPGQALPAHRP